MRFVVYAAFILFTILCVIIAVANNTPVLFSLEPLPINIEMPAFGLVFLGILIGLSGGWVVSIVSGIRHARRHRLADKRVRDLEAQLNNDKSENSQVIENKKLSNPDNNGKSSSD